MAVRINKAQNFKGKAYVAADELDNLIKSMTLAGAPTTHFGSNADNNWVVNFTNIDGTPATTSAVDLTAIKDYIDNKSITVTAGNGISIDDTGSNALNPIISTNLKIVKLGTATDGYAASYQLQYLSDASAGTYTAVSGDTINIVKDQFIKTATFGWSTANDASGAGWTTTKSDSAKYPCIQLELYAKDDAATPGESSVTTLWIPLNDVFVDKTAGNGINATDLASNVITVVADTADTIYTAKGSATSVMSVGANGVKASGIQAAIDLAVNDEHAKASSAVAALDDKIDTVQGAASAAVDALNSRIVDVAGNAATAITNASANLSAAIASLDDNATTAIGVVASAVTALDTKVSAAIDDVNTKVEGAIDSTVGNVNTAVSGTVTAINTAVSGAVADVNTKVGTAITGVSAVIDSVQTAVESFENTVSATVSAAQSAVDDFKDSVNTAITSTVAARSTQLANAVEIVDSEVTLNNGTNAGEKTATVTAKYIIAVYGAGYEQIYPEIVRGDAGTYTLTAEYGSAAVDSAWHVLIARDLPTLGAAGVAAYTAAGNTVAFEAADNDAAYTGASYSPATATSAAAVDADDVVYAAPATVTVDITDPTYGTAATTVGNGTPATAPAKQADITESALDYQTAAPAPAGD